MGQDIADAWGHGFIFQSTHPVWDGTGDAQKPRKKIAISIHPSRVGWDTLTYAENMRDPKFQSTHPVWDGTIKFAGMTGRPADFNPPIPCGMGHVGGRMIDIYCYDFNPPIPCGMGQLSSSR